jgi:hypothetical protein
VAVGFLFLLGAFDFVGWKRQPAGPDKQLSKPRRREGRFRVS